MESRDRWIRAASGWERRADAMARDTLPVSAWLVEAIEPQPGHTVLDLAAGIGDTGYLALELIQPGGELITSDFAPEMLAAAQRRAPDGNIRFRQIDLSVPLDQPAASIDGVLCRWGYMLLNDPEHALRETRRILKPDGKVALAAWTGPDDNLWSAAIVRALQRRNAIETDPPGAPGQFAWANSNDIEEALANAGFVEHRLDTVDFVMRYDSVDDWWVAQTLMSTRTADADQSLDFATRSDILAELERAVEPFADDDGRLEIPARTWVAVATA